MAFFRVFIDFYCRFLDILLVGGSVIILELVRCSLVSILAYRYDPYFINFTGDHIIGCRMRCSSYFSVPLTILNPLQNQTPYENSCQALFGSVQYFNIHTTLKGVLNVVQLSNSNTSHTYILQSFIYGDF